MVIITVWMWHIAYVCHIIQYTPEGERGSLEYILKFTVVSQNIWEEFCVPCFWHSPKGSSLGTIWSGNWAGQVMSQKWEWVCIETLSWELVWKCVLHEQWLKTSCAWWQSVWTLCLVGKLVFKFQIQSDASRTPGLPPYLTLQYQNPLSKESYTKCILPILMP